MPISLLVLADEEADEEEEVVCSEELVSASLVVSSAAVTSSAEVSEAGSELESAEQAATDSAVSVTAIVASCCGILMSATVVVIYDTCPGVVVLFGFGVISADFLLSSLAVA